MQTIENATSLWNDIQELQSSDTNVKKYIFKKSDAIAEAVLYRYGDYNTRTVMCISTQTGCEMGCSFCGTGKFFGRDLTDAEILSQVTYMMEENKIDHTQVQNMQIMVMSMGEPVLNSVNLATSFHALHGLYPKARLLISTSAPQSKVGWDNIHKLAEEIPTVGLQFSVHASNDTDRNAIMPMKAKLNLEQIALEGLKFYQKTNRKPFFNYCVTTSNNSSEDAWNLRLLFDPRVWEATLSVVCESNETVANSSARQETLCNEFSERLKNLGFNTRVFNPAGQDDIGGGCGQLWMVQQYAKENPAAFRESAGNKIRIRQLN